MKMGEFNHILRDIRKKINLSQEEIDRDREDICIPFGKQWKMFKDNIKLETELKAYRERESMREKYNELENEVVCSICLENRRNCLIDCHHLFCFECATDMINCPLCKKEIVNRIKIF